MGTGTLRLNKTIECPAADEGHRYVNPFVVKLGLDDNPPLLECPVCGETFTERRKYEEPGD